MAIKSVLVALRDGRGGSDGRIVIRVCREDQRPRLLLCLAIVWLVWGSSYLATRIGVTHLPPLLFGGVRFVIAGLLLLSISAWRGFRFAQMRGEWSRVATLGILVGTELLSRYQFKKRTPYDFYANAGERQVSEFGVGV